MLECFSFMNNVEKIGNRGTFHLVGLGLGQPKDVTVEGLEAIKKSHKIYLESYTSIMIGGVTDLQEYFGKDIIEADRDMVESNTDVILNDLESGDVAFLVVGDPLGATTHTDLILRASSVASNVNIIHNASIINAAAISGLNPNNFGQVVSIPFWEETWKPESFYDKICANFSRGLHTLCLLDIKVKEQSLENLLKGRKIYEKPRFMTVGQAAQQLVQVIENYELNNKEILVSNSSRLVALARVGTDLQEIKLSTLEKATDLDCGEPLHSIIIIGNTNDIEENILNTFI